MLPLLLIAFGLAYWLEAAGLPETGGAMGGGADVIVHGMAAPAGFAAFARQRSFISRARNCHRRAEHWGIRRAEFCTITFSGCSGGGSRDYLWARWI